MRNYEMIGWDMDGTLIESGSMWKETIEESLKFHNIELTPQEWQIAAGIPLKKILELKGVPVETIQSIYSTLSELVKERIEQGEVKWKEGAKETLALAKVPQAIITSSNGAFFNLIDAKLGIRKLVDAVVTADHVYGYYKPNPSGLLLATELLEVNPKNSVYIGDQLCDLHAAARAGMDALLLRGPHTPSHVIHTIVATTFKGVRSFLKTSFRSSL